MTRRVTGRVSFVLALVASAGCLSVPDGPAVECEATADCDQAGGEVCHEGVCWGNPPDGAFAAVISPPSGRKDLVARELPSLGITQDGWLDGLVLEPPAVLSGRIEALCEPPLVCDRTALGATITVTRGAQFPGGPGFKAIAHSEPGGAEGPSFELALPRDGDPTFQATIVPDGRGAEPPASGGTTAAQLVPPMRLELEVPATQTMTIQLGGLALPTVEGTLLTSYGVGLSHHRVVALGRWEADAPLTEVSTVDYTGADGTFRLVLSPGLVGSVEIVARPYGTVLAPTLHLRNVPATGSSTRTLVQPELLGEAVSVTVPVRGKDGAGKVVPVPGARVRVSATLTTQNTSMVARFSTEATTNDVGEVRLDVLDGTSIKDLYRLEVVPPASATVGIVYDAPLDVAAPPSLVLPPRIPIRGVVLDATGAPLKDVAVTARPSLRFLWSLEDSPQAFLAAIPAATATTLATGEFVVWVDPTVAGVWGHYDLVFEPAMAARYPARAPTFTQGEVEIPRGDLDVVTLPEVWLPDAAFVHGVVADGAGEPVEGAELKVFRVNTTFTLCGMVKNAPASCPIPALLEGRGASDGDGMVRVTLPR